MNKKLYWGLLALIILFGTAFVFIMLHDRAEIRKLEEELANVKKQEQHVPQQADAGNRPPREARAGHKWEWHGDHWHEMPTFAPDTRQDETVEPAAPSVVETKTYEGPLTYHEELLKTNPVKALRLQAEERGHWSAEHIPPFPPDDTEAQEFAKNQYLTHYYESVGDESNSIHGSIYGKAARAYLSQINAISEYPFGARKMDLMRLTWTRLDAGKVIPYGGMTRYGRARMFPSDYFPNFIDVPE